MILNGSRGARQPRQGTTMRELPVPDPGEPDHRSAARYLWWVVRSQPRGMLAAAAYGIVWMVAQALMPAVIGHAIDAGVTARDGAVLALWTGLLFGLGVVQAAAGVARHRNSVLNWVGGAFLTVQVTVRKAVELGAALPKRLAAGEVVSIGVSDVVQIGGAMDICGRGSGSVVAIIVVAVIMLTGYATVGWVTRLADLPKDTVRRTILVCGTSDRLLAGRLRGELDPFGAGERVLIGALRAASATDIVDALPAGLDAKIADSGREFSGGQQQRLKLARALTADPPVLVLVEPTSAVDAHTEARIAARLGAARASRTTVIAATSPLILARADHVAFVAGGKVVAEGSHADLLASHPGYAATVTREEA
jgi:ABC-type multidrug transport system fused ATPase/permease subunit